MSDVDYLRDDRIQPAWLMFVDSNPPIRLFSGVANFQVGPTGPDTVGGVYQGLGIMVQVPSLTIPLNGAYKAHTFMMSGVSAQMMAAVNADRNAIRGARIAFARVELDASFCPREAPAWIWVGWIDSPRMVRDGRHDPPTRSVSLVCATGAVRRGVQQFSYYTPPQQAIVDPADTSCNNVPTYAAGTTVLFPT